MSIKTLKIQGRIERVWHDIPLVVVEDNDIDLALQNLRRRNSNFGIIRREKRSRYTRTQKAKRHRRAIAERKKQRYSLFTR